MILGIITARMKSSRLPGKVMLKICGKPVLELMLERVKQSKTLDKIVVATSSEKSNDIIVELCDKIGIECVRGPEDDLVARCKIVCDKIKPKVIVKMGADSILIDPQVIDKIVNVFLNTNYDFVSNYGIPKTYPEGCTADVYSSSSLIEAFQEAKKPSEREHITPFFWNRKEKYRLFQVDYKKDISNYRLSLDYKEDYIVIKSIYEALYKKNSFFNLEDIIEWLNLHPDIIKINAHIPASEGVLKSLEQDGRKLIF